MFATALIPRGKVLELHPKEARLKRVESSIVALNVVIILFRLPVVANHFALAGNRFIVRGNRASFAARTEILARIESKRCRLTYRAALSPAILRRREIFSTVRLARVFDYDQVIARRDLKNGVHVRRLAVQVNRNDGGDRSS